MSYSDELTEKELKKLEKTIAREYAKAYRELHEQAEEYFRQFEKRDTEMREALENGSYPVPVGMTAASYYKQWRQNQMARGERWEKLRDNMANRIVNANKQAAAYVNDKTPSIYSLNYNHEAYQIETVTGARFDIYDEQTVKQLMLGENHIEFRTLNPNPVRDYAWNSQKINSELISGILQGKSIPQLTDGFMSVMQNNRKAAVRNARTAVTSAQNGGRMESYRRASEMGIEIQKEWMATKDTRTRDSHAALDGVIVKYDEDFPNGLSYPGDPKGAPAEVYNCRCTMVARLPGYSNYSTDNTRTGNTKKSYERWLNEKNNGILIPKGVGAKGKNYRVSLPDGSEVPFTKGTRIENVKTIAGRGRDRQIDEVDVLVDKYGGRADAWQKKKGIGYLDVDDESVKAEIHWYEEPTAGKHEFKTKSHGGNWYIED